MLVSFASLTTQPICVPVEPLKRLVNNASSSPPGTETTVQVRFYPLASAVSESSNVSLKRVSATLSPSYIGNDESPSSYNLTKQSSESLFQCLVRFEPALLTCLIEATDGLFSHLRDDEHRLAGLAFEVGLLGRVDERLDSVV